MRENLKLHTLWIEHGKGVQVPRGARGAIRLPRLAFRASHQTGRYEKSRLPPGSGPSYVPKSPRSVNIVGVVID